MPHITVYQKTTFLKLLVQVLDNQLMHVAIGNCAINYECSMIILQCFLNGHCGLLLILGWLLVTEGEMGTLDSMN